MARVSSAEGIAYGIEHFGYQLAVFVFGILFSIIGLWAARGSPLLGLLLLLIGIVATYAGLSASLYKIIADGVAKGIENAESSRTARKVAAKETKETAEKIDS